MTASLPGKHYLVWLPLRIGENASKLRIAFVAALLAIPQGIGHAQVLAIRNVTVIDGSGRAPRRGVDVCIAGGRIVSVDRPCTAEPDTVAIDATGLYMTPGFVDMHVHVLEQGAAESGPGMMGCGSAERESTGGRRKFWYHEHGSQKCASGRVIRFSLRVEWVRSS